MLGAIIGDICGSIYEFSSLKTDSFNLMAEGVDFTDDTVLTIAIADAIMHDFDFARTVKNYAMHYENRGYGGRFYDWIYSDLYRPYLSYGNGSAMRVSSVGFYYDTVDDVLEKAKQSAQITHNHIEGIKGAQAVALSIFLARKGHTKEQIRYEIEKRFSYDLSRTLKECAQGYTFDVTCQGSVPEAIIAFLDSTDFESAIKNAILLKGDSDTQACIAGGIAEAYYKKIPTRLHRKAYELLPKEFVAIIKQFYQSQKSEKQEVFNKDFQFLYSYATMDTSSQQILFSKQQYEKMQDGFMAEQMEDKWDINFANDKLYFSRSWTGSVVYIAYFKESGAIFPQNSKYKLYRLDLNRNYSEYSETDDVYDLSMCIYLIRRLLLNQQVVYPFRNCVKYPELEAWSNVGRAAFEKPKENSDISFMVKKGNLTLEDADFIVNAANTRLILGSGVSHAFRQHCGGEKFQNYLYGLIANKTVVRGDVIISDSGDAKNFRYSLHVAVMNYSDKKQDMYPTYKHIEKALYNIMQIVEDMSLKDNISNPKIVIPLLGCGTGKLDKLKVFHLIKQVFSQSKIDLNIVVYAYNEEDFVLLKDRSKDFVNNVF